MKFFRHFLTLAATAGALTAGVCQALPTNVFGPIYPTVSNPCITVGGDKAGKGPEAAFGEMVHFTINGKVASVLDKTGSTPRLKFTIETHGEGMGATTGAKYVFDGRMETMVNAGSPSGEKASTKTAGKTTSTGNAAVADEKIQFDNIYKISAPIHSSGNSEPPRHNATIELPIKVSHVDGMTVAWPLNAQDNIRLTCQAAP